MGRHLALLLAPLALFACQENTIGTRNSLPDVTITSHFDDDTVVEGIPFVVRASAGDSDNLLTDLQATWTAANQMVGACNKIFVSEDGITECEVVLYSDSEPPRIGVEVRDPRGGVGTAAVTLDVISQNGGYHVPSAEIVSPADQSIVLAGQPAVFEGLVDDVQDPPTALDVEWVSSLDGILSTAGADSGGTARFVMPTLSSGVHVLTLKVTDTDGNFTSDVSTFTVNGAPTAPVVSISPDPAASSRDLQATIDVPSTDPEGDPLSYTYEWLKDGVPQGGLTSALVLASNTSRGETWTVRVRPFDGLSTGPFGEDSVTIQNAAPVIQSVTISPSPAFTDDILTANIVSTDADGDPITHTYDWHVNGVTSGQTGPTLDGLVHFDKGDVVQLWVIPSDGSASGAQLGSNILTIQNSPPVPPVVSISPNVPVEGTDDLICAIDVPSTDPDPGDSVTYDFEWDVNGVAYPSPGDAGPFQTIWIDDSADGSDTVNGETWTCSVFARDQTGLAGLPGEDSVTIGSYTFLPNYNGTFDIVPNVAYTCAGGLVSINVQQLTFSEVAGTLSITGAPAVMTQTPSPVDENFSATGVISGGCTETYTLGGTFQTNDYFIGTFGVSFNGWQCGLTNCTNQSWPVEGFRL